MKKILSLILILCMLTACAPAQNTPETTTPAVETTTEAPTDAAPEAAPIDSISLNDIVYLFQDMTDVGLDNFGQKPVTQETVGYEIGSQDFNASFESAVSLAPNMNINPFVLVVFRLAEDADAAAFAADLEANANPRKWVCVSADKVFTRVSGRTVLFVMCTDDLVQPLSDCFAQMTQPDFDPQAHIVNPLAGKTSQDLYDELYVSFSQEQYGFMDGQNVSQMGAETPFGLGQLDYSQVRESVFDDGILAPEGEEVDRAYLFGIFCLNDDVSAEAFAQTVQENLDTTALQGGEASHMVAYGSNFVIVYADTSTYGISVSVLTSQLPITYRMTAVQF